MSKGLWDSMRSFVDFKPTDTWLSATSGEHRDDNWLGATFRYYDETYGYRTYRCVKNTSGSSIDAALVVATDASAANRDNVELAPVDSPKSRCRGVTIGAIADGAYGWVVAQGKVLVTADTGGVTANTPLCVGNAVAGAVDTATVGTSSECGFATAAITAAATGAAFVDML